YALSRFGAMRLNKFDATDELETLHMDFGESLFLSPLTISEVKISEDTHHHVAGAVKIEVNNFLGMLRNVASRRDLKNYLPARRNLSKLLRFVAEPRRLTRPKSNKKNWDGGGDDAVKNKLMASDILLYQWEFAKEVINISCISLVE
ncbi:hypothetical protein Tco_1167533, partial [Tanacetum coccineum]